MTEPLKILSLGAGVQSSTVLLMSCVGELPKLDAAIFADTQWEPKAVYEHLAWLEGEAGKAGIPVYRVTRGDLQKNALTGEHHGAFERARLPLFVLNPDGSRGVIGRQCTSAYKIEQIERKARQLLGLKKGQRAALGSAEMWIGISTDEMRRATASRVGWYRKHFPLIFDKPMTRLACKDWLLERGFPVPPRSACLGCPFHSDYEWRDIQTRPSEWNQVVAFDKAIRHSAGMKGELFLHDSLKPLDEVDLSTAEERGQMNWLDECQGMCGL